MAILHEICGGYRKRAVGLEDARQRELITVRHLVAAIGEHLVSLEEMRPLQSFISWVGRAATLAAEFDDLEACAPLPDSRAFAIEVVRALVRLGLLDAVASDFKLDAERLVA